jgi:carbon monoxide dehydrogenase subunit G
MKVQRDITIGASPEEVWEVLMDPNRLKDWVSIHQKLKSAPDGILNEGDKLTQCLRLMHKNFDVKWEVEQARKPKKAVWQGRGPLRSKAAVVYELAPDGNGGTSFHYENEFKAPMGPLGSFFADHAFQRTSEREADRTLDKLKGLLESRG